MGLLERFIEFERAQKKNPGGASRDILPSKAKDVLDILLKEQVVFLMGTPGMGKSTLIDAVTKIAQGLYQNILILEKCTLFQENSINNYQELKERNDKDIIIVTSHDYCFQWSGSIDEHYKLMQIVKEFSPLKFLAGVHPNQNYGKKRPANAVPKKYIRQYTCIPVKPDLDDIRHLCNLLEIHLTDQAVTRVYKLFGGIISHTEIFVNALADHTKKDEYDEGDIHNFWGVFQQEISSYPSKYEFLYRPVELLPYVKKHKSFLRKIVHGEEISYGNDDKKYKGIENLVDANIIVERNGRFEINGDFLHLLISEYLEQNPSADNYDLLDAKYKI